MRKIRCCSLRVYGEGDEFMVESGHDTAVTAGDEQLRLRLRIDTPLSDRVDSHLGLLKTMRKQSQTKQDWIADAVAEKLQRDEEDPLHHPTIKRITVALDADLAKLLESKMEIYRRMGITVTKNRWVLEAVLEKLEAEAKQLSSWRDQLRTAIASSEEN